MFRSNRYAIALTVALTATAPGVALADYLVIWSQSDFAPTNMSNLPLCVGDMIGNGQNIIVGKVGGNTTQIRDAMTGALIVGRQGFPFATPEPRAANTTHARCAGAGLGTSGCEGLGARVGLTRPRGDRIL